MIAIAAMALAGLGVMGCQHTGRHAIPEAQSQYGESYERYTGEMSSDMAKMMSDMHAPGYSGDPDIDFLAMMIPHHQGAVDMARLVLLHGTDPVTRKLAEDIIASQQVEIAGMQRRLLDLKRGASRTDPGGYPALGGTRGGQEHGIKQ